MTRAGFVALAGKPNAGKSTLLNRLVGQKLSITSPKPQTTRDRVVGILTRDDAQLILLDTPGLLDPRYPLQQAMRHAALQALADADVVIHLADAAEGVPPPLAEVAGLHDSPRARAAIIALNKIDRLSAEQRLALTTALPDAHQVSALTGEGVAALLDDVTRHLPESPLLYPADDVSTQSVRFFAAELIRETALEQLEDEMPYSIAAEIEEFRESGSPVYIRAIVYVERESQKRILVGSRGSRIREIGRAARLKIESLVGAPVYLDLWVKVLHNWRRDARALRRFGYRLSEEPTR